MRKAFNRDRAFIFKGFSQHLNELIEISIDCNGKLTKLLTVERLSETVWLTLKYIFALS